MKKTINITLGSLVFNIEEDAFARLSEYLDGLKKHFGTAEYGQEVVNDIESRLGEQLNAKLSDRKKEAVTLADMDEVINTMGSIEDLTGEPKPKSAETASHGSKRLFRNPDDQIISGVAGGIASYFNIDPIIPRVVFVVTTLAGGWGILLYILLWIIVPEAQTSSQKLEMKGDEVNLATLTENRKEKPDAPKLSVVRYFLRELVYLAGRFIKMLVKILAVLIGLVATAASFVAIFAVTLMVIVLLVEPNSNYIHPAITQVFNGSRYVLLVISGYLSAIIPAFIVLLIGVSLVRRRNIFKTSASVGFAVVWLASALTFGGIAISSADQVQAAVRSIEEQPQQSRELAVSEFDSVEGVSDQKITITHGAATKVIIYGTENQVNKTQANVHDGNLTFSREDGDFRLCLFCFERTMRIEIITPDLKKVSAQNASNLAVSGFPELPEFAMRADNAGRITFRGSVKDAEIFATNAARVTLHGRAENAKIQLTNAARLDAYDFPATNIDIQAMNSSRADIHVLQNLKAEASGASNIRYLGNPVSKDILESNAADIEGN